MIKYQDQFARSLSSSISYSRIMIEILSSITRCWLFDSILLLQLVLWHFSSQQNSSFIYSLKTRMLSSRMHTARSSSCSVGGGVWSWSPWIFPFGVGLDLIPLNFPHWVWAWIWSPSISPLGVGLEGGLLGRGVSSAGGLPGVGALLGGGSPWQGSLWGGLPGRGVCEGVSLAGGSPWQGVSLAGDRQTPVDRRTPVKT